MFRLRIPLDDFKVGRLPLVCVWSGEPVETLREVRVYGSTGMRMTTKGLLPISPAGEAARRQRNLLFDFSAGAALVAYWPVAGFTPQLLLGLALGVGLYRPEVLRGARVTSQGKVNIYRLHPQFIEAQNHMPTITGETNFS